MTSFAVGATNGPIYPRPCPGDSTLTVAEALERERPALLPRPEHPFTTDRLIVLKSGKTPYVRFDLNDYSIPHTLIQKPLTLVASPTLIRILDGTTEVARHTRSWDRHAQIEETAHIAALASEKRAARESKQDRLRRAVPQAARFLEAAVLRNEALGAIISQLLRLLEDYGVEELGKALDEAIARETPTPASVAHILEHARRKRHEPPRIHVNLPDNPRIRDLRVAPHNLETYDELTTHNDE
jgi:hypothetical protein